MRDLNCTAVRLGLEFAELGDGDRSEEPSAMRHYVEDGRRQGREGQTYREHTEGGKDRSS